MLSPLSADSPAMTAALNAAAQAGREAGYLLRQSPAVREQWRCLNLAGMYRQGRDYERARLFIRMSREWRCGGKNFRSVFFPKQSVRVLGLGLGQLISGEEDNAPLPR